MTYNIDEAVKVLNDAVEVIKQRNKEHGDTEHSFQMIGEMWSVYLSHVAVLRGKINITPFDVANMLDMVKKTRSIYGYSHDNFVDSVGYTALAAMLHPKFKLEREDEKITL